MIFICYPKCSTCLKAKKYLDDNNIVYQERNIKTNNPNKKELGNFIKYIDVDKLFNKSGLVYKSLNLKDKLKNLSIEQKIELLSANGMLIKRPLLITNDKIVVGFKEVEYNQIVNKKEQV